MHDYKNQKLHKGIGYTAEIFFAAGMFYLVIAYVMVRAFKLLERRLRVDACQGR